MCIFLFLQQSTVTVYPEIRLQFKILSKLEKLHAKIFPFFIFSDSREKCLLFFAIIVNILFIFLQDYVLTEAKCRTIVRQICRGVQYIHSQNFLHLDIKPFNIVFTKRKDDYDLRIIDFGLARELKEDQISMKLTKFSGTVGKTFYIPRHIIKLFYKNR